jgi:hypothetical protein
VGDTKLGAEYIKNRSNGKDGYIAQVASGQYSFSYRDIKADAIDPAWATNYHYADSKGVRARADYKVSDNSILTIYQDIAKNNASTVKQDITYVGFATYF